MSFKPGSTVEGRFKAVANADGDLTIGCTTIRARDVRDYATDIKVTEPKPVYKVGDRVEYVGDFTPNLRGQLGTVTRVSPGEIRVDWDDPAARPDGVFATNLTPTDKPKPVTYQAGDVYLNKRGAARVRDTNGKWRGPNEDGEDAVQATTDAGAKHTVATQGGQARFVVVGGKAVTA
jgi:hypothetical protein